MSLSATTASPEDAPAGAGFTPGPRQPLPPDRYRAPDLLRSEWTKLRTVRSTLWTLGVTIVVGVGVSILATAESSARWASMSPASQASFDPLKVSLVGTLFGQLAIGVLGILVISAEYGTGTIRATLSAAPRRLRVLGAKVVVFGVVALAVAEAVSFVSFFVGQALLTAPTPHTTLGAPGAMRAVAGTGLFLCVIGLFAFGLAVVIRHTAGAISAYVAILLVAPIIVSALPQSLINDITRFLPFTMGQQFVLTHPATAHSFSPWSGLALLGAYTAAVLAAGAWLLVRRDA